MSLLGLVDAVSLNQGKSILLYSEYNAAVEYCRGLCTAMRSDLRSGVRSGGFVGRSGCSVVAGCGIGVFTVCVGFARVL